MLVLIWNTEHSAGGFVRVFLLLLLILWRVFGWGVLVFFFFLISKTLCPKLALWNNAGIKEGTQKCRIILIWKASVFTQVFHSNKVIILHRNAVAGLYYSRNVDLFLPQNGHQNVLALDLNPRASRVSGCRSSGWCGRGEVQPCPLCLGFPALPCWGLACLPPTPSSVRATAHYSICFKNKQANKKPTVKICKSLPTNFQHLPGVCQCFLHEPVLLILLLN